MIFTLIACRVCEGETNYISCNGISQSKAPLAQAELWTQEHLSRSVRWGVRREQRERAGSILTASLLCYFCFPAPDDQSVSFTGSTDCARAQRKANRVCTHAQKARRHFAEVPHSFRSTAALHRKLSLSGQPCCHQASEMSTRPSSGPSVVDMPMTVWRL